jgi:hypothetical protein
LTTCAFFGTGNVLEIQKLVQVLSEHIKTNDVEEIKDGDDKVNADAAKAVQCAHTTFTLNV